MVDVDTNRALRALAEGRAEVVRLVRLAKENDEGILGQITYDANRATNWAWVWIVQASTACERYPQALRHAYRLLELNRREHAEARRQMDELRGRPAAVVGTREHQDLARAAQRLEALADFHAADAEKLAAAVTQAEDEQLLPSAREGLRRSLRIALPIVAQQRFAALQASLEAVRLRVGEVVSTAGEHNRWLDELESTIGFPLDAPRILLPNPWLSDDAPRLGAPARKVK